MIDYYYKFTDHQQALEVMQVFTYTDGEGTHLSQGSHQWAIDNIGELTGSEGWHVNLRLIDKTIDISNLEPYIVTPNTPKVVWG